ncbi:hypothetical protein Nmel_013820 [Mimus melanotis]
MTFQAQFLTFPPSQHHFDQFILRQDLRSVAKHPERGYLQSMVRHSLLSLHEAPMGLRDTPLQKGVILLCRGLRGCLRDRDTPWLCNRAGRTEMNE